MGDLDDQLRRLAQQRAARTPMTTPADVFGAAPRRTSRFPVLIAAAAIFAALAGLAIWLADGDAEDGTNVAGITSTTTTTTSAPDPTTPTDPPSSGPTVVVSADDYGVLLRVPETWLEIEPGRTWGGDSGFAAVDVVAGGTLAEAADASIAGSRFLLGSAPTIAETTVAGRPALLISGNEPAIGSDLGEFVMGAVVIEAPTPITVHDESWAYLTVGGDLANLPAVLASLEWIPPATPPTRSEIVFPDPNVSYDLVVGTAAGIELRRTFTQDVDIIPKAPTELAFFIDGWLVSQAEGRGPVQVQFVRSATDQLDLGEGRIRLQDAAIVDGRATALVTRRTGTTPEDTKERLLMVDLADRSVTDLGVVGGWESGVDDARFADGAIALLKSAEGFTWIAALDYSGTELWTTPETFDGVQGITVFSDTVSALNPTWTADLAAPFFETRRFELRSGDLIDNVSMRLTPVDGVVLDEVYCRRLVSWPGPSCGQAVGAPVEINFYSQTIAALPGALSGGTPTAVDAAVSTEFPPLAPCEADNGSAPEEILLSETILLPDGGALTVIVFEQDGDIYVQAVDAGWRTNRLALSLPVERADGLRIGTTPPPGERDFDVDFDVSLGTGFESEGVYVAFDGCELSVAGRWQA
jgi:hypothetical protein